MKGKLRNEEWADGAGKGGFKYTPYSGDSHGLVSAEEGVVGVKMSKRTSELKDSSYEYDATGSYLAKNIDKRNFYNVNGTWVDSAFKKAMTKITIRYGSKAYFKLLELKPELKDFLALGTNLVLTINDKEVIIISDAEDLKDAADVEKLEEFLKE